MNAHPFEWRRTFPGITRQVSEARRFVAEHLPPRAEVETAQLIVSELATNAIRHTGSGEPGGRFMVTVRVEASRVWLGVLDEGGAGRPEVRKPDDRQECGRGLDLVDHLAQAWGVHGDERSRTVWATVAMGSPLPCA
ncbi:ATP-binding protein [Herbidospora galbida]|uniref:ATP-binding protein n=1 Tax=Herbidospora galbida TaxID=2575442 RepID=A0A4U3MAG3_9ACTN|nr:ATP-binding protein [Herbidospora galbida]TKK85600.1 ATP-binding protein [Herbidospora galbida]